LPHTVYYVKCTIRSSDIVPGHSTGDGRGAAGGSGVCEGGKTHGYNIIYYAAQNIYLTRLSLALLREPKIRTIFHSPSSIASRAVPIIIIYTYCRYLCWDNALYGVIHLTGYTNIFAVKKKVFTESFIIIIVYRGDVITIIFFFFLDENIFIFS